MSTEKKHKMSKCFLKFLIFPLFLVCYVEPSSDDDIQKMVKEMLHHYDPRLRPDYLGPPVKVLVDATILSFTNLDAINNMYTVDMFFRQRWKDHRLTHNLTEILTLIVGTRHPSDIIWVPDTVFINSVTSAMHHVTVNNHKLDIEPDGTVFWGTRVTVSPACYLDLRAYPMDRQQCHFEIVSYAYDSQHLKYVWKINPGVKIIDKKMAQFELTDYETENEEIVYVAGNYTVLMGRFKFKRLMGFAILQIYVPSIAIVCVSWISLWIRRSATPARVALCITTLLTISTIWASVNATLPRVNYVKAIDIFLMMSFICVIVTLLEYTIVLNCGNIIEMVRRYTKKHVSKSEEKQSFLTPSFNGRNLWSSFDNNRLEGFKKKASEEKAAKKEKEKEKLSFEEAEKIADKIEVFARFFFPAIYITFNVFYWTNYLSGDETSTTAD